MKITYDIIKKNIETYNKAKEIFPAISQFEDKKIDFTAMRGLGLGKFADFYMFMETVNNNGYTPIINTNTTIIRTHVPTTHQQCTYNPLQLHL